MVRNVMETRKLKNQLVDVAMLLHVLLAQSGYISELMVHGIGPIPVLPHNLSVIQTCFPIGYASYTGGEEEEVSHQSQDRDPAVR